MCVRKMLAVMTTLACISPFAVAHHGANGQFDMDEDFEVSGTITRVRLINPHAYLYFDVENEAGETVDLRCALSSGSSLKRLGWSADMFEIGSVVTINGSPDRDDPNTCHLNSITLENGLTVTRESSFTDDGSVVAETRQARREDGTINLDGNWAMLRPEEDSPGDRRGNRPTASLTAAGAAAVIDASPEENPRFNCQATNIILDWTFNEMVNNIAQTETEITLTYGFMDLIRTIHLDGREMPDDFEPNRAGYSSGEWDGDTLIVTTTGFDEGWIMAPIAGRRGDRPERDDTTEAAGDRPAPPEGRRGGPQPVKNSTELTVVERFTLSSDGTTLTRDYAFIDPLYLEEPLEGSDAVVLTSDAHEPYACEELADERVQ